MNDVKNSKNKPFMLKAIELAKRGFSSVEPNPMVGCVITKDGQIIGEGWHKKFGQAHAEINALADCKNRGHKTEGATVCVTLEPCCHHGKTGPCTQALIEAKVAKVVIAMLDPSDKVSGKGVKQLEEAGIKVTVGLCQKEAHLLNPGFIKHSKTQTPWVITKWAQTIDGKLSAAKLDQQHRWISNEASRKDVHKLRRSCQAILVGINTVLTDDPLLTARPPKEKQLLRIVLDTTLRIPLESKILNSSDHGDVLIVTTQKTVNNKIKKVSHISQKGCEVLAIPENSLAKCDLNFLLKELGARNIQRLLIEGGVEIIRAFIEEDLADEAIIYIAPKIFAGLGSASINKGLDKIERLPELFYTQTTLFDGDVRINGWLRHICQI